MNRFNLCVIWLKVVSALFSVFGIVIALFNQSRLFQVLFSKQINPIFWGNAAPSVEALLFQQWVYGLLGATCVMVGVLLLFIVHNAYSKKEKWARNCMLFALSAWFIIDELVSMYFGVYFNAIFNLVLLIAVLVPICLSYKDFKKQIKP